MNLLNALVIVHQSTPFSTSDLELYLTILRKILYRNSLKKHQRTPPVLRPAELEPGDMTDALEVAAPVSWATLNLRYDIDNQIMIKRALNLDSDDAIVS